MYAKIENGKVIQVGLPEIGTLKDGRVVSGYNLLPTSILASEGWIQDYTPSIDIEELRTTKQVELDNARDVMLTRFASTALGTQHTYQYKDEYDRELFKTVEKIIASYPDSASQAWYVVDIDAFVPHTKAQIQKMFADKDMHFVTVSMAYGIAAATLKNATTAEEIDAIKLIV